MKITNRRHIDTSSTTMDLRSFDNRLREITLIKPTQLPESNRKTCTKQFCLITTIHRRHWSLDILLLCFLWDITNTKKTKRDFSAFDAFLIVFNHVDAVHSKVQKNVKAKIKSWKLLSLIILKNVVWWESYSK